ncbi:Aldo/keto reductase [Clavulina sp. PMI_390]|nr:Aldo/keto reductase [Clavulina sp. PMI_390]
MTSFTLVHGSGSIPAIGLGTSALIGEDCERAIQHAVKAGYRHFDLAINYGNQEEVGRSLKKVIGSAVKREELFISSKLWCTSHHPEDVEAELDLTLKQLDMEYLDLYLIHLPVALLPRRGPPKLDLVNPKPIDPDRTVTIAETWLAMQKLLSTGKVKNVGVSNFTVEHIEQLIRTTGITPAVNEVELHPYLIQEDLVKFCREKGIVVTGYAPLASPGIVGSTLLQHPVVEEVAKSYPGANTANILLNWGIARGCCVIPKSITPERITSNLKEFKLTPEDVEKISEITKEKRQRYVIPAVVFGWQVDMFGEPAEAGLPKVLIARES